MNIYLVRHGDAEKTAIGKKDFDRDLTPEGKIKIKSAVANWKIFLPDIDFIVTSPYIRALNTAKIIAETYEVKNPVIIDKKLSPGSKAENLIEIANSLSGEEIVFVGHQPDLSGHLSNLISGSGANIEFKKGAVAKITFRNKVHLSKGVLEYLIPAGAFK